MGSERVDDPNELLPAFRVAVEELMARLAALGHKPRLFETYRTPARSAALVKAGRSRASGLSMHCYRIASDIICREHGWSCDAKGCDFYYRLGAEAPKLGMTWGGDWDGDGVTREQKEHDLPHVQGIPLYLQRKVRKATLPELEEMLAAHAWKKVA